MAELVELDVEKQAASHGQHQCSIQKNQPSLTDVGVVKEDKASGDNTRRQTVARFPHDQVGDGDSQGAEKRWQGPEG